MIDLDEKKFIVVPTVKKIAKQYREVEHSNMTLGDKSQGMSLKKKEKKIRRTCKSFSVQRAKASDSCGDISSLYNT